MPMIDKRYFSYDMGDKTYFSFTASISVSKEGIFSTTLPSEAVLFLESYKMNLNHNRIGNAGYFVSKTIDGLKEEIDKVFKMALSRKEVSQKVVLIYSIRTFCSFMKTKEGEYVPNGSYIKDAECEWLGGTEQMDALRRNSYGFLVSVKPRIRTEYVYNNGKKVIDYKGLRESESDKILLWLNNLTGMELPNESREIDYTPDIGRIFVNMIKYIFSISEVISDWTTPEKIKEIADKGQLLLLNAKKKEEDNA